MTRKPAKPHIGDCNFCPRKDVAIVSGWTTRNRKTCRACEYKRKAVKQAKAKREKEKKMPVKPYPMGTPCFECAVKTKKCDRSHLLGRLAYPHLEFDPENIVPHCRDCHMKWENDMAFRKASITYAKKIQYIVENGGKVY